MAVSRYSPFCFLLLVLAPTLSGQLFVAADSPPSCYVSQYYTSSCGLFGCSYSACLACPAGSVCNGAIAALCPAGSYCIAGSKYTCASGLCPNIGTACPTGFSCSSAGITSLQCCASVQCSGTTLYTTQNGVPYCCPNNAFINTLATVNSVTTCQCDSSNAGFCPDGSAPSGTYVWQRLSSYSSCSATCGGGTQVQSLSCYHAGTGVTVANNSCTVSTKPTTVTRACNTQPCPTTAAPSTLPPTVVTGNTTNRTTTPSPTPVDKSKLNIMMWHTAKCAGSPVGYAQVLNSDYYQQRNGTAPVCSVNNKLAAYSNNTIKAVNANCYWDSGNTWIMNFWSADTCEQGNSSTSHMVSGINVYCVDVPTPLGKIMSFAVDCSATITNYAVRKSDAYAVSLQEVSLLVTAAVLFTIL